MASQTIKGLLGQPVITLDTGRRVGSIQEILYSAGENRVFAIVLSKPPVAGAAKAVAAEHVALFGADVTLVESERWIRPLSELPTAPEPVRAGTNVIHTQVLTVQGRRVGEVSDIVLDERGNVVGYQVSQNVFRNALRGMPFVPVSAVTAVGADAILIQPAVPATVSTIEATPEPRPELEPPAETAAEDDKAGAGEQLPPAGEEEAPA